MKQNLGFALKKTDRENHSADSIAIIKFLWPFLSLTLYYQNLKEDLRGTKVLFLVVCISFRI